MENLQIQPGRTEVQQPVENEIWTNLNKKFIVSYIDQNGTDWQGCADALGSSKTAVAVKECYSQMQQQYERSCLLCCLKKDSSLQDCATQTDVSIPIFTEVGDTSKSTEYRDVLICGNCDAVLYDLQQFVEHKQSCVRFDVPSVSYGAESTILVTTTQESGFSDKEQQNVFFTSQTEALPTTEEGLSVFEQTEDSQIKYITQSVEETEQQMYTYVLTKEQMLQLGVKNENLLEGINVELDGNNHFTIMATQPLQENLFMNAQEVSDIGFDEKGAVTNNEPTSLQPQNFLSTHGTHIQLMPIPSSDGFATHAVVVKTKRQITAEEKRQMLINSGLPVKKRGRPRKSETAAKKAKVTMPEPVENTERPPPEIDNEGRYSCKVCQKAFTKERHYNTHRCLTWGDYVDLNKKEIDHLQSDSGEEDTDYTRNFTWSGARSKRDKAEPVGGQGQEQPSVVDTIEPSEDGTTNVNANKKSKKNQVYADMESSEVESLPLFTKEEDKVEFDRVMNVDLSFVDNMISVHNVNQKGSIARLNMSLRDRMHTEKLTLYTCNNCKRAFMTHSHCRLHCVSHTNLKPFKCIKCDFASNAKGPLYNHMRKHTGQLYRCSKCPFNTGNRSHLLEHEDTHKNAKKRCSLCKKSYSTTKSLINHIRSYHSGPQGEKYLMTFMKRGPRYLSAVLHECGICKRKFKKRIDRDRHVATHKGSDAVSIVFMCDVCPFSNDKPDALHKHIVRHKIIYCCVLCDHKFASSSLLLDHLKGNHDADPEQATDNGEDLYTRCINSSLYLNDALSAGVVEVEKITAGNESHYITKHPDDQHKQDSSETNTNLPIIQTTHTSRDAPYNECETALKDQPPENDSVNNTLSVTDDGLTIIQGPQSGSTQQAEFVTGEIIMQVKDAEATSSGNVTFVMNGAKMSNIGPDGVQHVTMAVDANVGAVDEGQTDTGQEIYTGEGEKSIYFTLGYQWLTTEILQSFRDIYGKEECEYCGHLFATRSEHLKHNLTHSGTKPFMCDQCTYQSATKSGLQHHIQRDHEKVSFNCAECEFVGRGPTQLYNHRRQMHSSLPAVCTICMQQFDNFELLKAHLSIKHSSVSADEKYKIMNPASRSRVGIGRRVYKCPICEDAYLRSYTAFQKHLWTHEGIKPFQCTHCSYACRCKANLKSHMLRHNKQGIACRVCGRMYHSRTALRWHERAHANDKAFKCPKCCYKGTTRWHLVRHMEAHQVVKRIKCHQCDYSANTVGYMKVHYAMRHQGFTYRPDTDEQAFKTGYTKPNTKVFKCSWCEYLFGNYSDLKRHLRMRHLINSSASRLSTAHPSAEAPSLLSAGAQVQSMISADSEAQTVTNADIQEIEKRVRRSVKNRVRRRGARGLKDGLNSTNEVNTRASDVELLTDNQTTGNTQEVCDNYLVYPKDFENGLEFIVETSAGNTDPKLMNVRILNQPMTSGMSSTYEGTNIHITSEQVEHTSTTPQSTLHTVTTFPSRLYASKSTVVTSSSMMGVPMDMGECVAVLDMDTDGNTVTSDKNVSFYIIEDNYATEMEVDNSQTGASVVVESVSDVSSNRGQGAMQNVVVLENGSLAFCGDDGVLLVEAAESVSQAPDS